MSKPKRKRSSYITEQEAVEYEAKQSEAHREKLREAVDLLKLSGRAAMFLSPQDLALAERMAGGKIKHGRN